MAALLTMGIVLGLSAGLSPGPLLTFVIAQSLRYGAREGVKVALVPLITDLPIILLTAFILSRLAGLEIILGAMSVAGGLFLLYLAYEHFHATALDFDAPRAVPHSLGKGILINLLSPNPVLFWLTVGAPLIIGGWAQHPVMPVVFLAGFYGALVGAKMIIAATIGASSRFFTSRPYRYIMRFLGALLVLFALMLFWNALTLLGVSDYYDLPNFH